MRVWVILKHRSYCRVCKRIWLTSCLHGLAAILINWIFSGATKQRFASLLRRKATLRRIQRAESSQDLLKRKRKARLSSTQALPRRTESSLQTGVACLVLADVAVTSRKLVLAHTKLLALLILKVSKTVRILQLKHLFK